MQGETHNDSSGTYIPLQKFTNTHSWIRFPRPLDVQFVAKPHINPTGVDRWNVEERFENSTEDAHVRILAPIPTRIRPLTPGFNPLQSKAICAILFFFFQLKSCMVAGYVQHWWIAYILQLSGLIILSLPQQRAFDSVMLQTITLLYHAPGLMASVMDMWVTWQKRDSKQFCTPLPLLSMASMLSHLFSCCFQRKSSIKFVISLK